MVPTTPRGWGLFPALTLSLCLVRGRGHGLRVSTAPCVTARVDGHIQSDWGGEGWQCEVLRPVEFSHTHEERVTAGLIWDVCYSEAALAASLILKFSHLVQFQVIPPRLLQSLGEDWNCALAWQRT